MFGFAKYVGPLRMDINREALEGIFWVLSGGS
jgi:hypothetical protein